MRGRRRLGREAQRHLDLAEVAWGLSRRALLRELAALFEEENVAVLYLPWLDSGEQGPGSLHPETVRIDVLVAPGSGRLAADALARHGWVPVEGFALRTLTAKARYAKGSAILLMHGPIWTTNPWPRRLRRLEDALWEGSAVGISGLLEPKPESLYVFRTMQALADRSQVWNDSRQAPNPLQPEALDWDEVRQTAEGVRLGEILRDPAEQRKRVGLPESVTRPVREAFAMRRAGYGLLALPKRSSHVQVEGLELDVAAGVFKPRLPITSTLIGTCISLTEQLMRPIVVEVGTGCGAIALAFANRRTDARVVALDISDRAVSCARRNRNRAGSSSVYLAQSDLLDALPERAKGTVDVVVANIPYVPPATAVRTDWGAPVETARGLDVDGLGLIVELARQASAFLRPGGSLLLQFIGWQWQPLAAELKAIGYEPTEVNTWGEDRAAIGSAVWGGVADLSPEGVV